MFFYHSHSGGGLFFFLLAIGLVGLAVSELVKKIFCLGPDNRAPRLTAAARVAARRNDRQYVGKGMKRRCINNSYYITFELEDGTQMELWLYKRWYKRLTEGTVGRVTWQGTRFISFELL